MTPPSLSASLATVVEMASYLPHVVLYGLREAFYDVRHIVRLAAGTAEHASADELVPATLETAEGLAVLATYCVAFAFALTALNLWVFPALAAAITQRGSIAYYKAILYVFAVNWIHACVLTPFVGAYDFRVVQGLARIRFLYDEVSPRRVVVF